MLNTLGARSFRDFIESFAILINQMCVFLKVSLELVFRGVRGRIFAKGCAKRAPIYELFNEKFYNAIKVNRGLTVCAIC